MTEDYIFDKDFLRFLTGHFKKRKKSCFFEMWKKRKIRILEHWPLSTRGHLGYRKSSSTKKT